MNIKDASRISLLVFSTAACSGHTSETASEGSLGADSEALSEDDDCDTVSANKTTSGMPGNWTTSASYDVSGCHAAYRLDATNYIGLDLVSDPNKVHVLGYGDSVPTTRSECEKLRFGLYIWEGSDFIDADWNWGSWSGGSCRVPSIEPVLDFDLPNVFEPGRLRVQEDYRFAMSARRYSRSLDSSSSFVTKKIRSEERDY